MTAAAVEEEAAEEDEADDEDELGEVVATAAADVDNEDGVMLESADGILLAAAALPLTCILRYYTRFSNPSLASA